MEITPDIKQRTEELFKKRYLELHPKTILIDPSYIAKCVDLILDCIKDFSDEIKAIAFVSGAVNALIKYGYSTSAEEVLRENAKEIIGR